MLERILINLFLKGHPDYRATDYLKASTSEISDNAEKLEGSVGS